MIRQQYSKDLILNYAAAAIGSPNSIESFGRRKNNLNHYVDVLHRDNLRYNYIFNVGVGRLEQVNFDPTDRTDIEMQDSGYLYKFQIPAGYLGLLQYSDALKYVKSSTLLVTYNLWYPALNVIGDYIYSSIDWKDWKVLFYKYLDYKDSIIPESYFQILIHQMALHILQTDKKGSDKELVGVMINKINYWTSRTLDSKFKRQRSNVGGFDFNEIKYNINNRGGLGLVHRATTVPPGY